MSQDRRHGGRSRPYAKLTIAQLEGMFAAGKTDRDLVGKLAHELGFRDTDRAARLRARVAKAEEALSEPAASSRQATPSRSKTPVREKSARAPPTQADDPASRRALPQSTNHPGAVLAAWTAIEALSPQTYRRPEDMAAGDKSCVADLTGKMLPWETGEPSRRNRKLYYLVILGAIPMAKATERLAASFGADEEQSPRLREKAAVAAVLLDGNGVPVENGVSVSSFAWALPQALRLQLDGLGAWPEAEPAIVAHLDGLLRRHDKDGQPLPLDRAGIVRAQRWLVREFGLPDELVEPPSFALRIHHSQRAKQHPDVALVNSFFLGDLKRAAALVSQGQASVGLRRYLGQERAPEAVDLLADQAALEEAVAPATMPLACWLHPGGHALVLLQQAAVNLARAELAGGEGLIAVNGPPGTGKTTLLRDVVATAVFDRALAMAAFDDPNDAFKDSGESLAAGEKAAYRLYRLAPSLKEHEIVVASSNNKAVENISRELPATAAIGRAPRELAYFPTVGAQLEGAASLAEAEDDEGGSPVAEPIASWGMIAAMLGKRRNLAAFQQAFWWDDERSFRLYLKAAKGDDVSRDAHDPETGAPIGRRPPVVVAAEHPPLPDEAGAAWRAARDRLLTLKEEVKAELQALEEVRRLCRSLAALRHDLAIARQTMDAFNAQRKTATAEATHAAAQLDSYQKHHEACLSQVAESQAHRPGLLRRVFRTGRWRDWHAAHAPWPTQ